MLASGWSIGWYRRERQCSHDRSDVRRRAASRGRRTARASPSPATSGNGAIHTIARRWHRIGRRSIAHAHLPAPGRRTGRWLVYSNRAERRAGTERGSDGTHATSVVVLDDAVAGIAFSDWGVAAMRRPRTETPHRCADDRHARRVDAVRRVRPRPRFDAAPLNGRILFTHCDDEQGCQIYTVELRWDPRIRQVTTLAPTAFYGDWSPDGKTDHLRHNRGRRCGDLDRRTADGSYARAADARRSGTTDRPLASLHAERPPRSCSRTASGHDCDGGIGSVRAGRDARAPHHPEQPRFLQPRRRRRPGGGRMTYMRWHVDGVKIGDLRLASRRLPASDASHLRAFWAGCRIGRLTGGADRVRERGLLRSSRARALRRAAGRPAACERSDAPSVHSHSDWNPFVLARRNEDPVQLRSPLCGLLLRRPVHDRARRQRNLQRIRLPFDAYEPRWGTAPLLPPDPALDARVAPGLGGPPCAVIRGRPPAPPLCP